MALSDALAARANAACELCDGAGPLEGVQVPPRDEAVALCATCLAMEGFDGAHWRCLQGAVWSEVPAVQVLAVRLLRKVPDAWGGETLDMVYLDPELQGWADDVPLEHRDAHGALLSAGDTVVLIKDLPVKGAGFTAKRGTAVRGISLVSDNAGHIEGRVEGQRIVILTEYVKRK